MQNMGYESLFNRKSGFQGSQECITSRQWKELVNIIQFHLKYNSSSSNHPSDWFLQWVHFLTEGFWLFNTSWNWVLIIIRFLHQVTLSAFRYPYIKSMYNVLHFMLQSMVQQFGWSGKIGFIFGTCCICWRNSLRKDQVRATSRSSPIEKSIVGRW